jgi:beta-lactamase superfamily II metal-dependent hydrolase
MDRSARFLLLALFFVPASALAFTNGNLQIHFMDVGQGDGAILISPGGETVLFDNGVYGHCDLPLGYLKTLGISRIDYHVASHYHADHIGCSPQVFKAYPLTHEAYDRGGSYNSSMYTDYVKAVGTHRATPAQGTKIVLDATSANPVEIVLVALNGNGAQTTNENDLSLVAVVHFGRFDAEIGGDLSGYHTTTYDDVETSVAPMVGQVEVYKVHHHGSNYSSNDMWLSTIRPKVAIVSSGTGNSYGHPTQACLDRLHHVQTKTYWTESGAGATPVNGQDTVANGAVLVEAEPGGRNFTVTYGSSKTDRYASW